MNNYKIISSYIPPNPDASYRLMLNYRLVSPAIRKQFDDALNTILQLAKTSLPGQSYLLDETLQRIYLASCYANRNFFLEVIERLQQLYSTITLQFKQDCLAWSFENLQKHQAKEKSLANCDSVLAKIICMSVMLIIFFLNENQDKKRLRIFVSYLRQTIKLFSQDFRQCLLSLSRCNPSLPRSIVQLLSEYNLHA